MRKKHLLHLPMQEAKKRNSGEIKNAQGPGPPHFIFSTYAQYVCTRKAQAPVSDAINFETVIVVISDCALKEVE